MKKQTVIATIKREGLKFVPRATNEEGYATRGSGFQVYQFSDGSLSIEWVGRGETTNDWVVLANALRDDGALLTCNGYDKVSSFKLMVDDSDCGEEFDVATFIVAHQAYTRKLEAQAAQQEAVKQAAAKKQALNEAKRMARARELNPDLGARITWMERSENGRHGVGFVVLTGDYHTHLYVAFHFDANADWRDPTKVHYNLGIYHTSSGEVRELSTGDEYVDRRSGASSASQCTSVEEGLLKYVASWEAAVKYEDED